MLKKISCIQARPGMYVHKIEGSWLNSPFWQSSFLIDSVDVIATLRANRISTI